MFNITWIDDKCLNVSGSECVRGFILQFGFKTPSYHRCHHSPRFQSVRTHGSTFSASNYFCMGSGVYIFQTVFLNKIPDDFTFMSVCVCVSG